MPRPQVLGFYVGKLGTVHLGSRPTFPSAVFSHQHACWYFLAACQVNVLTELSEWCDQHAKGHKFKGMNERKRFAKEKGVKLVTNPKTGKLCVPVFDKTLMLTGNRHSTKRVKEQAFDDRNAAKDAFSKQRAGMHVETNTKVGRSACRLCFLP